MSFANGYSYARSITIDHTKVSADQSNFPVLVSGTYAYLAVTGSGGNVQNSNGYDIVFASDINGNTPLYWEIEKYVPTTGEVVFWVKLPTVSASIDTVFYMFYGKTGITTFQSTAASVWDSNYQLVMHLKETSALSFLDSTGKNSPSSPGYVGGGISKLNGAFWADRFVGQAVNCGPVSGAFTAGVSVVTVEFWGYKNNQYLDERGSRIIGCTSSDTNPPFFRVLFGADVPGGPNVIQALFHTGNWVSNYAGFSHDPSGWFAINTWYHIVIVLNLATLANSLLFVNGSQKIISTFTGGTPPTTFSPFASGQQLKMCSATFEPGCNYTGGIDEFRISSGARSVDWALTSYRSQNNPSTFYSVGSELTSPPGGASMLLLIG